MKLDELISDHSENAVICLSEEYIILELNAFAERALKLSRQNALHKDFFALCTIKNIQLSFNAADLMQQSKTPKFLLGNITLKNKMSMAVEWKAVRCESKNTKKPFFLLIIRTILAQDKNKISSVLYLKEILENLPEYIYWKDLEFTYQGCNKHVASYLGLNSPRQIVGKTDYDFNWSAPRIKKLHTADKKVVEKKINVAFEDKIPVPDGPTRIMLTSKSPLFDKEDKVIGILGVSTDITELKKAKRKLVSTKNKLDAMTLLSSSIAHELRTPFASLDLGATAIENVLPNLITTYELAQKNNLVVPEIDTLKISLLHDLLSDMKSEIRAAFTFIDMLLVKLNPSASTRSNEIFSITQCIQQVLEKYPFENNQQKLINVELLQDFDVRGSLVLVSHIFFNLFKNSLYYIASSGKGEISITLEKNQPYNKVYFRDTGAGISATILPKIFSQFFSKTYHGTGIGLAFCKRVMKSMRGKITCTSVEGDYTLFTLFFPSTNTEKL